MPNKPDVVQQVITASGAVTPQDSIVHLAPANSLAMALTLGAISPIVDGVEMRFIDEIGKAHTVVIPLGSPPSVCLNGGAGNKSTLTFNGTVGSGFGLVMRNGSWWTTYLQGVTIS